jgi:hypothetical protein
MHLLRKLLLNLPYATKGFIQFNFPNRKPGNQALMVALPQAIMIITDDGNNIVLTPSAARELVKKIPVAIVDATASLN